MKEGLGASEVRWLGSALEWKWKVRSAKGSFSWSDPEWYRYLAVSEKLALVQVHDTCSGRIEKKEDSSAWSSSGRE